MMNYSSGILKRSLLSAVCGMLLSSMPAGAAEQLRLSVLFASDKEPYQQAWTGFKESMAASGFSVVATEIIFKESEMASIRQRLTENSPRMIVALGAQALKLAENVKDIPIVYCMVLNPQEYVEGVPAAGVSLDIPQSVRLKQIKKLLPEISTVGLIYSSRFASTEAEIRSVCAEMGLKLEVRKVDDEKEIPDTLKNLWSDVDCLLMVPDSRVFTPMSVEYILLHSLRNRYPVIGLSSFYTKAGALIAIDCDYTDLGRQAGEVAHRIIDGETPASIGVLRPRKTRYSLNLLTAERLDVRFPSSAVNGASEVYSK